MSTEGISSQGGNWAQLRTLVLRLLEAHETQLNEQGRSIAETKVVEANLRRDINRCLTEIFGDASHDSLTTAIRLVQAEQAGMRRDVDGAHAKANAAHAKANENAKSIAALEQGEKALEAGKTPDGEGKASNKMVMALIAVISTLVQGLFKLVEALIAQIQGG